MIFSDTCMINGQPAVRFLKRGMRIWMIGPPLRARRRALCYGSSSFSPRAMRPDIRIPFKTRPFYIFDPVC